MSSPQQTTFIYGLWDPRNYQLRYIGKTKNLDTRLRDHVNHALKGKNSYKNNWIRQLVSEGLIPSLEVLEECDNGTWEEAEKAWIAECKKFGLVLVNLTEGGEGAGGYVWTEEGKRKISIANKGHHNPYKGKPIPESQKQRMLEGNKKRIGKPTHARGKKFSLEHKESLKNAWVKRKEQYGNGFTDEGTARIREKSKKWREENKEELSKRYEAQKGKPRSEETKKKLREANLGKKLSSEVKEKISKAVKGKTIPPMKGKKWSPEMIEVFRERSTGRPQSEETRKKRSETLRSNKIGVGRKLSEEHKRKISEGIKRYLESKRDKDA